MKDLIDINEATLKKFVESLRPEDPEILKLLDYGYNYDGRFIEVYEIRPVYDLPDKILHSSIAKIRHIKSKKIWKLYWMRANLKWYLYEPFPESSNLEQLLNIVKEDAYGCFFG